MARFNGTAVPVIVFDLARLVIIGSSGFLQRIPVSSPLERERPRPNTYAEVSFERQARRSIGSASILDGPVRGANPNPAYDELPLRRY